MFHWSTLFYCYKILPPLLGHQRPTNQTRAQSPIYTRTGRVTSAAAYAVLALKKLTNRWEGDADAPPENGRPWGTGKNKGHESGNTSRRGGLSAATNSFATGTSSLLASFTSLSLAPLQRDGPIVGPEMLQ